MSRPDEIDSLLDRLATAERERAALLKFVNALAPTGTFACPLSREAFHGAWTATVGTDGYNKQFWLAMERKLTDTD